MPKKNKMELVQLVKDVPHYDTCPFHFSIVFLAFSAERCLLHFNYLQKETFEKCFRQSALADSSSSLPVRSHADREGDPPEAD